MQLIEQCACHSMQVRDTQAVFNQTHSSVAMKLG
jgi:hypothetical protein